MGLALPTRLRDPDSARLRSRSHFLLACAAISGYDLLRQGHERSTDRVSPGEVEVLADAQMKMPHRCLLPPSPSPSK